MQNVTQAEQQRPRRTVRKKKWRLSKVGKFRLFFIALLLVLFGASYGITSLVLLSSPVSVDTPDPEPEAESSDIEVSAPAPVTDPELPTILTGLTVTENDDPIAPEEGETVPEGEEGKSAPEGEEGETTPEDEEGETPSETEDPVGEEPTGSENEDAPPAEEEPATEPNTEEPSALETPSEEL